MKTMINFHGDRNEDVLVTGFDNYCNNTPKARRWLYLRTKKLQLLNNKHSQEISFITYENYGNISTIYKETARMMPNLNLFTENI